ncbi:TonB-dependent receptor [Yunchengibacter salinarum]|uniref:TonB-dependent receptor n=1 Tax=Yunchengibacter salinarum TaxID=3133399 RepID=UPI0035B68BBB
MMNSVRKRLLCSVALGAVASTGALAQQETNTAEDSGGSLRLEEVVVTGRVGGAEITKLGSSVAISTFGAQELDQKAPLSAADLMQDIPGFWVEASGGVGGNNLFARGIPADGSFRYTALHVDGLPVFEAPEIAFGNADQFVRTDAMTDRVEAVRGGTSAIFASNAPGGIVNYITKRGTPDPEGEFKVTYGDFDLFRTDFAYSGPVSENLMMSFGGFYRRDDGVRDPGFTANQGGQFQIGATYLLDKGEVSVYARHLNDKNVFYLPIPLQNPESPEGIPGLDANTGTLTSADVRIGNFVRPGGIQTEDMQDGIHPEITTIGGTFDYEIGGGWRVKDNWRFVDGNQTFNALFSLSAPQDAEVFLDGAEQQLQDAFGSDVSARISFANSGSPFDVQNANGNGLVINSGWWSVTNQFENFQNDLQFFKEVGSHNLTLGAYFSTYSLDSEWLFNDVLQEVRDQARLLDVDGVDAQGNVVGSLTQNGFTRFGSLFVNAQNDATVIAGYVSDEWNVTDRLRIDLGARWERMEIDGAVENTTNFNLSDSNALLADGAAPTLADDAVGGGTGSFTPYDQEYDSFSWSVGANYFVNDDLAVYARVSDAFRMPDFDQFFFAPDSRPEIEDVQQAEVGVKYNSDWLSVFATGFFSKFNDLPITQLTTDGRQLQLFADTETLGIESEIVAKFGHGFEFGFQGTLQNPELKSVASDDVQLASDPSGNRIRRLPSLLMAFKPAYNFELDGVTGRLSGDLRFNDDRWVDVANTVSLPSYWTLDIDLTVDLTNNITLAAHGNNLTNAVGLTEGNPRTGVVEGVQGDIFSARPILGRSFIFSAAYKF